MLEHPFQCPYCWETITVLIDASQDYQAYVEDCEVCCNPIDLEVTCESGELQSFSAQNLGQ